MWRFWIDVGGTFTDCLAVSPGGDSIQTKLLSSGLSKGSIDGWKDDRSFSSEFLIGDGGPDFWKRAMVRLIDCRGQAIHESRVASFDFDSGTLKLADRIGDAIKQSSVNYELGHSILAPILAIRKVLKLAPPTPLPDCRVYLGSTRGTNALLTRSGAATALVTTKGFRDLLEIGDQARPNLFDLTIQKLKPLCRTSIEVSERVLADGTVETQLDPSEVRLKLKGLKEEGIESVAICLMHGYRFPKHEQVIGDIAQETGFANIHLSSDVAPLIKIVPRGETTVLDAYLSPVLARYLDEIQGDLSPESQLRLMTSSGGLVPRSRFYGKDSVLSGPAGGVVGAARIAEQAGFDKMIGFDMGGTSCDVSRYDGKFEREFETRKAGVRIVAPIMAVETVAAGGGSVCSFDGSKLVVGPESSGSDPGPVCYGRGGPLSITDINLFLGRIRTGHFPFPLDRDAVQQQLQRLQSEIEGLGYHYSLHELAEGFLKIANHNMSAAIRTVSIAKGYDPRDYVLVSFGGAGSQHCCAVAAELGMTKILDHQQGSILSAVGIRLADQTSHAVATVSRIYDDNDPQSLTPLFEQLIESTVSTLLDEGCGRDSITCTKSLDLRYLGTDAFLTVPCPPGEDYLAEFGRLHFQRYGYVQDRHVEVVAARVEANSAGERLDDSGSAGNADWVQTKSIDEAQDFWCNGQSMKASLFDRSELKTGGGVSGPAIVTSRYSTTIIDPGWVGTMQPGGALLIEKTLTNIGSLNRLSPDNGGEFADPVQLEIFNNCFSSIARQMGISLQKTSASVNVKERLDFSCAIFGAEGDLVVNAPHIPVHLGAMSETVRAIIRLNARVRPGDVFITNDPYAGGSHLPDITVVTPVFGDRPHPVFWTASRSHHAEIGGIAPGSMPANATKLGEEGVLIQNFKLVDAGVERFESLRKLLISGDFPSRSPDENLADVGAQVAANRSGANELLKLVETYGLEFVQRYMRHIQDAAETKVRLSLRKMPDGVREFEDSMDNGATLCVSIEKQGDAMTIDFSGTDPVLNNNLNANPAIVSAAVMYVMRCLIADDIPLNEGVMKGVKIILPECFLNPRPADDPCESPAVVGGNVETSQRIVDVILGALGLAAASCGTMNNWLIGNESFGYYETVGGGSGATPSGCGAHAVHTHMTNTRLTDPEILETRFPVVLREFSVRRGSGGRGKYPGGDGMRREIEFRQPLTLSLLTSRRTTRPFGLAGGASGKAGHNLFIKEGETEPQELGSQCQIEVNVNDRLILLTPGGGGFGQPE